MAENTKSLSDTERVAYLEQLSGKRIRKREDISAYVAEISQRAEARRSKWQSFKNATLSGLDQPTLTVFVPTTASPAKPYL